MASPIELKLAFWNCALSPTKDAQRFSSNDIEIAILVIRSLFTLHKVQFVGLCEISKNSYDKLYDALKHDGIDGYLLDDKTFTGAQFDLAYFYLKEQVFIDRKSIVNPQLGSSSLKAAQHLLMYDLRSTSEIDVLMSHWPSRLQSIAEDFKRRCSNSLRHLAEELIHDNKQVIFMGDYNDEPYSDSIFKNLYATNDRALVLSSPNYWLYNPFWKLLAPRVPFKKSANEHDFGTCYSKSGNRNKWAVFDQMLFSGNFLTDGKWILNESGCDRVFNNDYLNILLDSRQDFDHFPVISTIEFHGDNK